MRFYVTGTRERALAVDEIADDEESLATPQEVFGKNSQFILTRVYTGRPNWNFLFNYWSSLYNQWVKNLIKRNSNNELIDFQPFFPVLSKESPSACFPVAQSHWIRMSETFAVTTTRKDLILSFYTKPLAKSILWQLENDFGNNFNVNRELW